MRQNRNTPKDFISDLAQIANGAASAFGSLRAEMDVIRASRTDRAADTDAQGAVHRGHVRKILEYWVSCFIAARSVT